MVSHHSISGFCDCPLDHFPRVLQLDKGGTEGVGVQSLSLLINFCGGSCSVFAKRVAGGSLNTTANLQNKCCCKEGSILAIQTFHLKNVITIMERKDWGDASSHN